MWLTTSPEVVCHTYVIASPFHLNFYLMKFLNSNISHDTVYCIQQLHAQMCLT